MRQQAWRRFDQHDLQVFLRVNMVKAVTRQHVGRRMQFGRQLNAGRAAADDGDRQNAAAGRARNGLRANTGIDEPLIELPRGFWRVELDGVFSRSEGAEVIGLASNGNDQRVIG